MKHSGLISLSALVLCIVAVPGAHASTVAPGIPAAVISAARGELDAVTSLMLSDPGAAGVAKSAITSTNGSRTTSLGPGYASMTLDLANYDFSRTLSENLSAADEWHFPVLDELGNPISTVVIEGLDAGGYATSGGQIDSADEMALVQDWVAEHGVAQSLDQVAPGSACYYVSLPYRYNIQVNMLVVVDPTGEEYVQVLYDRWNILGAEGEPATTPGDIIPATDAAERLATYYDERAKLYENNGVNGAALLAGGTSADAAAGASGTTVPAADDSPRGPVAALWRWVWEVALGWAH